VDTRNLPVTDAELERVRSLLSRAVGQGSLQLDEFAERLDAALAARTRAQLNAAVADLPGVAAAPHLPAEAVDSAPISVSARWSSVVRAGRWRVPSELPVRARLASVKLDFSRAELTSPVVRVELAAAVSSVTLILPRNGTADTLAVSNFASSISTRADSGPPYGPLHVVLAGSLRLSSLSVDYPLVERLRRRLRG